MVVRIVLWSLADSLTSIGELRRYLRDESVDAWEEVDGLRFKAWISDPATDRWGAVYALPLAFGGVALAGYHTMLVAGMVPKAWVQCGAGVSCSDQKLEILNGIQIPWLSLMAFVLIAGLLLAYLRRTSK